jgi:Arf-GAP/Rho-GAP domain/ANK repeat/PH domain-containing protein 3
LIEDSERDGLIEAINDEIGLKHPITYDAFDLCQLHQGYKLNTLNVALLKSICSQLDIPFKSKERKRDLIEKIAETILQCECSHM